MEAEPNPLPVRPRAALLLGWSCVVALTISDAYPSWLAAASLGLAVAGVWLMLSALWWAQPGTSPIGTSTRGTMTVMLGCVLILRAVPSVLVTSWVVASGWVLLAVAVLATGVTVRGPRTVSGSNVRRSAAGMRGADRLGRRHVGSGRRLP
jgi:hypothetical protein